MATIAFTIKKLYFVFPLICINSFIAEMLHAAINLANPV